MVSKIGRKSSKYTLSHADFEDVFHEEGVVIKCVVELRDHVSFCDEMHTPFMLAICISRPPPNKSSIVCLFDARLGRVVKSIECPFRVTCMDPVSISEKGRKSTILDRMSEELEAFHGILALGTEGGAVFFVDLCMDREEHEERSKVPSKLTFAVRNASGFDILSKRQVSETHRQHVALDLDSGSHTKNRFAYRSCESSVVHRFFHADDVFVNCVKYMPQINSVCVSYNFGGFHVYNMRTFEIDVSCDLQSNLLPVVKFEYQEPENDPSNQIYIWLVRGSTLSEENGYGVATAHLYTLTYGKKEWIVDYGALFSDYQSCRPAFDLNLTAYPYVADPENGTSNSVFISCSTLVMGNPWVIKGDDEDNSPDRTLFMICWEASTDASEYPLTYFAIFDMNQYYHQQLPSQLSVNPAPALCPYLGVFTLSDVTAALSGEVIIDFKLHPETIRKYRCNQYNHDLHFYPSSLSFEVTVLSERSVVEASYHGLQKRVLSGIRVTGPHILIDPRESITNCTLSGLFIPQTDNRTVDQEREAILTVMLHNDEVSFLIAVIKEWSSEDNRHVGCTCKFLLNWIWNQVSAIKTAVDTLSAPLFKDCNDVFDSTYALKILYSYEADLRNLKMLIKALITHGPVATDLGKQTLEQRLQVTSLIATYLRVMLWMIDCKLLPENEEGLAFNQNEVVYPEKYLTASYKDRRKSFRAIHPCIRGTDVLIIDAIIEDHKHSISTLWKSGGGSSLFPPPTVHLLLGIYLKDNVPLEQKHVIMLYFLLEMTAFLDDSQAEITEKLQLFPSSFSLKPALTKLVQGIWGLDQGYVDFGVSCLLHPAVRRTYLVLNETHTESEARFIQTIHRRMITSLIYQGHYHQAQKLSSVCKNLPPFELIVKDIKEKMEVTSDDQMRKNLTPILTRSMKKRQLDRMSLSKVTLDFNTRTEPMEVTADVNRTDVNNRTQDPNLSIKSIIKTPKKPPSVVVTSEDEKLPPDQPMPEETPKDVRRVQIQIAEETSEPTSEPKLTEEMPVPMILDDISEGSSSIAGEETDLIDDKSKPRTPRRR